MKGYRLLSDIREEFKVSYQTLDKHIAKLNITKKTIDRRVYIKEKEYEALYNSLNNSRRIKKIAEIDYAEFETESHREELLKQQITFLEKRVEDLEKDINFKNKEIENFHGIVAASSLKIEGLERQVKLLEEVKDKEIENIESKLDNTIKEKNDLENKYKKEISIKEQLLTEKEIAISKTTELEDLLKEERKSKEIILSENNRYKNMKFKDKLKFLFNK